MVVLPLVGLGVLVPVPHVPQVLQRVGQELLLLLTLVIQNNRNI